MDTKATGRRPNVMVLAALDESASLCGMDGQQADGYRSSYEAQYQMVQVSALWQAWQSACAASTPPRRYEGGRYLLMLQQRLHVRIWGRVTGGVHLPDWWSVGKLAPVLVAPYAASCRHCALMQPVQPGDLHHSASHPRLCALMLHLQGKDGLWRIASVVIQGEAKSGSKQI